MPNETWVDINKYEAQTSSQDILKKWEANIDALLSIEKKYTYTPEKTIIKNLVRNGIPDELRGKIYAQLLQIDKIEDYEKNFQLALTRTWGEHIPTNPTPPTFGGRITNENLLALTPAGQWITEHILCIIAHDFPSLEYCPFIPTLISLLAHHLRTPDELLGGVVSILKRSFLAQRINQDLSEKRMLDENDPRKTKSCLSDQRWAYFPVSKRECRVLVRLFRELAEKMNGKLVVAFECEKSLEEGLQDEKSRNGGFTFGEVLVQDWFRDFFIMQLPQDVVWRFFDCFILEGYKTFLKFGLNLISLQTPLLKTITKGTPQKERDQIWKKTFQKETILKPQSFNSEKFATTSANITVTTGFTKRRGSLNNLFPSSSSIDELNSSKHNQRGQPKKKDESSVIDELHWIALWSWMPSRYRESEIELVFTTSDHGYNLNTMLKMTNRNHCIIVVQTISGETFGAFVSGGLIDIHENKSSNRDHKAKLLRFHGDGETFLFTLKPFAKLYRWVGLDDILPKLPSGEINQEISSPTTNPEDSLFILNGKTGLSIGGGGKTGLWLNESLTSGTTSTCSTFQNEPLTGNKTETFECAVVEVFCFTNEA